MLRSQHRAPGVVLALLLILVAGCDRGSAPTSDDLDGFVIMGAAVFDGEVLLSDVSVVVLDGRVEAVTDELEEWAHLPVVDGAGGTLLPGFIDAHTHTQVPSDLNDALRFGVTTVLDMATSPKLVQALRGAAATRSDVADFRSAGFLATAPEGHGTEYGIEVPTVADAEAAAPFVAARVADGADHLKIVLNGVRVSQGFGTLDAATTRALIDAGHNAGLVVAAHVESIDDVRTVADAGIDGLAHIWRDSGAQPELAALLAERGIWVIPTIAVPDGFTADGGGVAMMADARIESFLSDAQRESMTPGEGGPRFETIEPQLAAVASLVEAGVSLLVGSDVPNGTTAQGVSVHRELELLVEAGLSPAQALTAATANVADAFGLADRGRIRSGARADLLLVRGDPTTDITATRDLARVWRGGVEVDRGPSAP